MKLPKIDRYKTVSLKTSDISDARDRAFDHDAELRFRIKHDVPIFNKPFSDVAQEYVTEQDRRARWGEISAELAICHLRPANRLCRHNTGASGRAGKLG